jgi:outer membrane protein TolC
MADTHSRRAAAKSNELWSVPGAAILRRFVDEPGKIPQAPRPMQRVAFSWLIFLCLTAGLSAQPAGSTPGTNGPIRLLSREECLRLALENNLTLRISRRGVREARFGYKGSVYGYYEPTLTLTGQRDYTKENISTGGDTVTKSDLAGTRTVAPFGVPEPQMFSSKETNFSVNLGDRTGRIYDDSVSAEISGRTPFGTVLSLNGTLGRRTGDRFGNTSLQTTNLFTRFVDNPLRPPPVGNRGFDVVVSQSTTPSSFDDDINSVGLTLTQPLLRNFLTDADRTQIQINRRDLKISEFDLEKQVMDVVRQVLQTYYDVIAARDSVKVAEKAFELARQLLAETKRRVEVGVATPLDEKQVESEVATRLAELIEARRQRSSQENALKQLITGNYAEWYDVTPEPGEELVAVPESFSLNESWLMGITLRPDYNQARLEIEKSGLVVRLQRNQILPQLDFVGSVGQDVVNSSTTSGLQQSSQNTNFTEVTVGPSPLPSSSISAINSFGGSFNDSRNPRYGVGVVFSIPLGGNLRARQFLKQARERHESLKESLQLLHLQVLVNIENSVRSAQASFEQVSARRQARIYAEAALDAEQKKLENGKSTSFFVLDFQKRLTDARAAEIRALADYNKALVQLHFEEGSILDRNKVSVNFE